MKYVVVKSSLIIRSVGPNVVKATVCPGMSIEVVQLLWVRGAAGNTELARGQLVPPAASRLG